MSEPILALLGAGVVFAAVLALWRWSGRPETIARHAGILKNQNINQ